MNATSDNLGFLRNIPKVRFAEEDSGYNKSQVDRVLESIAPVADAVEDLQTRLAEAQTRVAAAEAKLAERGDSTETSDGDIERSIDPDFDETLRKTLLLAQRTADTTIAEAEAEAIETRSKAESDAAATLSKASEEAEALLEAAKEEKAAMLSETASNRERLLGEAQDEAARKSEELQAELDSSVGAARDELASQAAELTQIRDSLAQDIDNLESHLAERRAAIKAAVDSLSEAVDGKTSLGAVDAPVLSDVDASPNRFSEPVELPKIAGLDTDEVTSESSSSGFVFGEGGPKTELIDVVGDGEDSTSGSGISHPTQFVPTSDVKEDSVRPAWADSVPPVDDNADIVIDPPDPINQELSLLADEVPDKSDDAEEEALARFLDQPTTEGKTGWFGRRK